MSDVILPLIVAISITGATWFALAVVCDYVDRRLLAGSKRPGIGKVDQRRS